MSEGADEIPEELRELVKSTTTDLESINPDEGVEEFLAHKKAEVRTQTVEEYRRKLAHFLDFCEQEGIQNLNQLNGRVIQKFERYRRYRAPSQEEPLSTKTMRDEMYLLQGLVRYLERIEAVQPNLTEKVHIPELGSEDGVRDVIVETERVERILDYLDKYQYATREHVVWAFFSHSGRRLGGLRAIDLGDLHLTGDEPYIEIRHRPGETELKNGYDGEIELNLSQSVAQIFKDYVDQNRIDVTTENGRKPFLTSSCGRLAKSTIRKYVYRYSRPCVIRDECPHNREIDSCEAAGSGDQASKCPSSIFPHALRHGYITWKNSEGVPEQFLSGRCDVSPEVIKKHYDERTESEKRDLRREVFEEFRGSNDRGGLS